MRFPRVIVPVLSSNRVWTSPAASTARPLMASTLRCTNRSIPAMPMAESRAPIVVGIKHTSNETRMTTDTGRPAYFPNGCKTTTTGRNTMVSTASKIVRAISFGVFCRFAPSTRPIIRSRNVWPRSAVMRTTMRSDRTFVPPVTAERSPPDSRMTGADSPVIADSSTEAIPSTISPSDGIMSPASQTTMSPLPSAEAGTRSSVPSGRRRRASVSERIRRSVSACALPRPSAIASAKLAKITVRKSQAVMLQSKRPGWAMDSTNVTTVPTSTTNITGFLTCTRGSSFLNESKNAWPRISRSKRLLAWATPWALTGAAGEGSFSCTPFWPIAPSPSVTSPPCLTSRWGIRSTPQAHKVLEDWPDRAHGPELPVAQLLHDRP